MRLRVEPCPQRVGTEAAGPPAGGSGVTARASWTAALERRPAKIFGAGARPVVALAPGRVNLIGEHTDYNDGWVLPMAIDRHVGVAAVPRGDRVLRAHAVAFGETREGRLDELAPPGGGGWFGYVAGTAWAMRGAGLELRGADLVVDGDLPLAAGLSSSAALEMATALALCDLAGIEWRPLEMARLGQKGEGEYVGVRGGVMDQFTAALGQAGSALLLDCRSLTARAVGIPVEAAVVVMDTGAPRSLAGSAYNDRSASCRDAVSLLRQVRPEIRSLRDVDLELLDGERERLGEKLYLRARFVVEETGRPLAMAAALESGDLRAAGTLMNASHEGLRELYQVSSAELDLITEIARRRPGCFGARLTGAGFGGCAIALVAADRVGAFVDEVGAGYGARVSLPSAVFSVRAEGGARLLSSAPR